MPSFVYPTIRWLFRRVLRRFTTWTVEGLENIPPTGRLILMANHLSNLDGPLMLASIPRRLHFIGKRGLFKPGMKSLLRAAGVYPMADDGRDVEAFLWARALLDRDRVMMLFPEAGRNPEGMRRAGPGVALLALRTQATIIPVGITGTERIAPLWRVFLPFGIITVRIGESFTLPPINGPSQRPQLESLTDSIMERVAALLPERYRGEYPLPRPHVGAPPSQAAPAEERGKLAPDEATASSRHDRM